MRVFIARSCSVTHMPFDGKLRSAIEKDVGKSFFTTLYLVTCVHHGVRQISNIIELTYQLEFKYSRLTVPGHVWNVFGGGL
jgi:hypothetical protein